MQELGVVLWGYLCGVVEKNNEIMGVECVSLLRDGLLEGRERLGRRFELWENFGGICFFDEIDVVETLVFCVSFFVNNFAIDKSCQFWAVTLQRKLKLKKL